MTGLSWRTLLWMSLRGQESKLGEHLDDERIGKEVRDESWWAWLTAWNWSLAPWVASYSALSITAI